MSGLKQAFEALAKELERLYGVSHANDFQDKLDALEIEVNKSETEKEERNVSNDKTSGGQVASKVGKVN